MREEREGAQFQVAKSFYSSTQFANSTGAVDGKHVCINNPDHCGSAFYNYKHFISIVLLALVDSICSYIAVAIETSGKSSNSYGFKKSDLGTKLH